MFDASMHMSPSILAASSPPGVSLELSFAALLLSLQFQSLLVLKWKCVELALNATKFRYTNKEVHKKFYTFIKILNE